MLKAIDRERGRDPACRHLNAYGERCLDCGVTIPEPFCLTPGPGPSSETDATTSRTGRATSDALTDSEARRSECEWWEAVDARAEDFNDPQIYK